MKNKRQILNICSLIVTTNLLLGCSHNLPAPVFDLSHKKLSPIANTHVEPVPLEYTVMPGDTLFSIAWYHSVDYRDLAKINQLTDNLIYPGQKLSLTVAYQPKDYFDSQSMLAAVYQEVLNKPYPNEAVENLNVATQIDAPAIPASVVATPRAKKAVNSSRVANPTIKKPLSNSHRAASRLSANLASDKSLKWIWPADGKLLSSFSSQSNANKGLDIAAKKGQAIRATAPGQVVYQGSGLRGYGNLVIIKHSNNYLSAYAHNDKIHVAENEIVKSGQRIADAGNSGTNINKLHFEIRYQGKPVDPLNYLPEKKF